MIDAALAQIQDALAKNAAQQQRIDFLSADMANIRQQSQKARGVSTDTDFAVEVRALAQELVRQRAAHTIIGQSAPTARRVLSLILPKTPSLDLT